MKRPAIALLLLLVFTTHAQAQQPVGDEAFRVLTQLFDYDNSIPLNARTLERLDSLTFVREKFVIDGWRGTRVPGLLATPKNGAARHPIILLIDGIGGWKERWWQPTSWGRGRVLVDSLLANGFAVVMIDAPLSGERSNENDYASPGALVSKLPQLRDLALQNSIEQRRLIDYLATRSDVDTAHIGALGLSLGGMITFFLGTVEPRMKVAVAGLTPLWRGSDLISPGNYAPRVRVPVLMLMGRTDSYYTNDQVEQVYAQLGSPEKNLVWYDVGHRLPEPYAAAAVAWFRRYLH